MKRRLVFALVVALLLCTGAALAQTRQLPNTYTFPGGPILCEYVDGEILVVLESPSAVAAADTVAFEASLMSSANAVASSIGAQAVQTYSAIAASSGKNIVHMKGEGKSTEELLTALNGIPGVLGAAPNYISKIAAVPNDSLYTDPRLWGMRTSKAPDAWDVTTGSRSVYVAVLDTGINYNHEDLAGNIGRDLENNIGKNTINNSSDPLDDQGHGTHVAGTIGAVGNNSIGVTGMNWQVSLLTVKVLNDEGSGSDAQIIAGLNYVLGQKQGGLNIRVANLSLVCWGNPIADPNTHPYGIAYKQLSDAGVLVVVAAGNEYQNIDNPGGPGSHPGEPLVDYRGWRCYPACFQFANMITVASITDTTARSAFSNYSPNFVHLAAPGSGILSTTYDGGYGPGSGTSMASPHVAGAAALIAAAHPTESAAQIKARILNNVTPNANLNGLVAMNGHLNVNAAIRGVAPTPEPGVRVTAVTIAPTTLNLAVGQSATLTATILPVNAADKTVTWTTNNAAVVDGTASPSTLTSNVSAISAGTATITVRTNDGGFTATCTITVGGGAGGGGGCSVGAGAVIPAVLLLMVPLAMLLKRGSK